MRYNADTNTYTLESTGRTFYAHSGVLGLAPLGTDHEDQVFEGYDGGAMLSDAVTGTAPAFSDEESDPWTPAERLELAAAMIARWRAWAAGAVECAVCGGPCQGH